MKKIGALVEYRNAVADTTREEMAGEAQALDFKNIDNITDMYHILVVRLLQGNVSPEVSAEVREVLSGATTIAAAKAQGIFDTEEAVDGIMALTAAATAARERRQTTRNVIDADE